MQIAERVQRIAASQSLAMAARAKAMKAAGIDVISMSLGEPDMDTPEHIRHAAQEAIDSGWTHYGPVAGVESLREAIAERANEESLKYINTDKHACGAINKDKKKNYRENTESSVTGSDFTVTVLQSACMQASRQTDDPFRLTDTDTQYLSDDSNKNIKNNFFAEASSKRENGIEWKAEDVIVSVGAKMAIYNAIQSVVNPGDEVIIPMPSWVSYTEMVKLAEGKVVPIQTKYEDRYCMTAEQLRKALTPRTRMLILCSPNNPTGSVYSYEELQAIVSVLREYPQVAVLSDEIYNALVYEPTPNPSLKGGEHDTFANVWGAHTADSTQYDLLKANAQANRKQPTEAETILWDMLKGNNIGLHFRRQHIILDYIVDFACIEKGLVIELDGGYHTNPEQQEYDEQRTAHLQKLGYTELRFTNEELLINPDKVVTTILSAAVQLPSRKGSYSLPFREGLGLGCFPEIEDRLIIVNGISKAYAMTGWRVGWLLSKNKAFIEACTRLQGQQVTCATMVAQKAAEAALRGSQECVAEMRQVFAERRELICRLAAEIPGWKFEKPQGAFYLFPNISALFGKFEIGDLKLEIDSADDLAEYLLEEAHVAVVSGSAFGCPECIRLSYAISTEEIIEAMRRIQRAITKIVNKQK